jgi:hypothetical protein
MSNPNPETAADLELMLSIGGLVGHVVLERPPADFASEVRRRFAGFAIPAAPHVARAFTLRLGCTGSPVKADAQGVPLPLRVDSDQGDGQLCISRWDFEARLQRADRAGGVGVPGETADTLVGTGETRPVVFAFESLLRVLWSALLPRAGGALFHACGFSSAGRGERGRQDDARAQGPRRRRHVRRSRGARARR